MEMNFAETEGSAAAPGTTKAGLSDYIEIMRLSHSTKHVFIVPGIVLALLLRGYPGHVALMNVILGFGCAVAIASANYVINEWLDRFSDQYHPTKSKRSAVQKEFSGQLIWAQWAALVAAGLLLALISSRAMLMAAAIFALQGIVYNVRPFRTKDLPYFDVIVESINNPLRLIIGWTMIDAQTLPPASIIMSYWFGGAFLMASKRLSEYRQIVSTHGLDVLGRYRASFARYSDVSLTVSCFVYAILASFLLAVFFIKYRIEYIVIMPLITILFGMYLSISMTVDSSAQNPEKLYKERGLIAVVASIFVCFIVLTFVDIPPIEALSAQHFIRLD